MTNENIWALDEPEPDWHPIEARDGWWVDRETGVIGVENPETGEVEEVTVPDPEALTARLIDQFRDAQEQAKTWDRHRQAIQRAIIRLAPAKRALYGDLLVTVVSGGETAKVDGRNFVEGLLDVLKDTEEAPAWREHFLLLVVQAGTRWTRDDLPVPAREVYDRIAVRTPRADHISVTPSLRPFRPRARRV